MNTEVDVNELVELCAVDNQLYCKTFFPRTARQEFPLYDDEVEAALSDPEARYVGLEMFRGSAKTTRLRILVSKRIAYALSNTILFVSNAQKHSGFSLKWIRKQVEFNTHWAYTYGLRKGATWNDEHVEILHGVEGRSIHLLALGITGQVRGINLDDFRPDFIVVDDPDNEETTNTVDQRKKTSDLVFGALAKSLAPPSENPTAKMVLLQTPFNNFDTISQCKKDSAWKVITISCFGRDGESTWPARLPTAFLLKEKASHIQKNNLSLWMREMECKIISDETSAFKAEWLKYWDQEGGRGLPPGLTKLIAIDPASSESRTADDQVVGVVGFKARDVYLIEYTAEKGEMPEACATTFIGYLHTHTIFKAVIEITAYQRVLAWFIEKAMRVARKWVTIIKVQDKRAKSDRIIQSLRDTAANGNLYVSVGHTKFIEQFTQYSPLVEMYDDVLDMTSMAIAEYKGIRAEEDEDQPDSALDESHIPDLKRLTSELAP